LEDPGVDRNDRPAGSARVVGGGRSFSPSMARERLSVRTADMAPPAPNMLCGEPRNFGMLT